MLPVSAAVEGAIVACAELVTVLIPRNFHRIHCPKPGRNWRKGTLGDALNAVLCGAGHNPVPVHQ
jgi:hypothetical protein